MTDYFIDHEGPSFYPHRETCAHATGELIAVAETGAPQSSPLGTTSLTAPALSSRRHRRRDVRCIVRGEASCF